MKRFLDILISAMALLLLCPLLLLISIWIKLESKGPILFRQERVGRYGHLFMIRKFRTMKVDAERLGLQLTVGRDPRITRAGFILRKYKLDELPQLIDVLVGSMSLVGPRPEVPKYVAHYPPQQREIVLSVRPGITDSASIAFFDESSLLAASTDPELTYLEDILPKKLTAYVDYVQRRSLWGDLRIMASTASRIIGVRSDMRF